MKTNLKHLQKLLFLLIMGLSLCSVSSCDPDPDKEIIQEPETEETLSIVGLWRYEFSSGYVLYYFGKDGNGWTYQYDEEDGGGGEIKESFVYEYIPSFDKIIITSLSDDKWIESWSILTLTEKIMVARDDYYANEPGGGYNETFYRISEDEAGISNDDIVGTWFHEFGGGYDLYYFDKSGYGWYKEIPNEDEERCERIYYYFSYIYNVDYKKLFIQWDDEYVGEVKTNLQITDQMMVFTEHRDEEDGGIENVMCTRISFDEVETIDDGIYNGHKYVDLGLSVKWATCNVGASSSGEFGDYYAWGETTPKSIYLKSNSVTYGKNIGEFFGDICARYEYDVASVKWGGSWRIPTGYEFNELIHECEWVKTMQGGHNGYKIIGPNGNSIFLPAAGYRYGSKLEDTEDICRYWTSDFEDDYHEEDSEYACCLYIDNNLEVVNDEYRYYGMSIRPVSR